MSEEIPTKGASFNMAVATLTRLDGILKRMETVSELTMGLREQRLQIKLLRHFFLNATPLMRLKMNESDVNKYRTRVYAIKIPSKMLKGRRVEYHSSNLDNEMMEIVIDIQLAIRDFFMPQKEEEDDDEL